MHGIAVLDQTCFLNKRENTFVEVCWLWRFLFTRPKAFNKGNF